MSDLRVAPDLALPIEVAGEAIALVAKRGAGKTHTGAVLVEELHAAGVQVVVLDPVGAWWGLRHAAAGREGDGLPIPILGGSHGDIPLEPTAGALIADVAVDTRQSLVVDLSQMETDAEMRRFATAFAQRLYLRKANQPSLMHLVLEEADEFAPQNVSGRGGRELPLLVGVIQRLVRRGRSRGIGVTMITQRTAVLNKDVLNQADVLIAMRMTGKTDRDAIEGWIVKHSDLARAGEVLPSLPKLATGEGWVWNPERDLLQLVKFRPRHTFDSSSTPDAAEAEEAPPAAAIDLTALGAEIAATAERAKENDPAELRRQITGLRRELANRPEAEPEVQEVEVRVEVPALDPKTIAQASELAERLEQQATELHASARAIRDAIERVAAAPKPAPRAAMPPPRPAPARTQAPTRDPSQNGTLNRRAERMVLAVLAQFPQGRTKRQTAILAGYSGKGGGFNGALSKLRSLGYIEGSAELRITEAGLAAIEGQYEPLPRGRDLLEHWLGEMKRAAERAVLQVVYDAYPEALAKEEIAERAGYEVSGGGFNGALSKLRTLELIEGSREIRASEALFG